MCAGGLDACLSRSVAYSRNHTTYRTVPLSAVSAFRSRTDRARRAIFRHLAGTEQTKKVLMTRNVLRERATRIELAFSAWEAGRPVFQRTTGMYYGW